MFTVSKTIIAQPTDKHTAYMLISEQESKHTIILKTPEGFHTIASADEMRTGFELFQSITSLIRIFHEQGFDEKINVFIDSMMHRNDLLEFMLDQTWEVC